MKRKNNEDIEIYELARKLRPFHITTNGIYKAMRNEGCSYKKAKIIHIIRMVLEEKPKFDCPSCGSNRWGKQKINATGTLYYRCIKCHSGNVMKGKAKSKKGYSSKPRIDDDFENDPIDGIIIDACNRLISNGIIPTYTAIRYMFPDSPGSVIRRVIKVIEDKNAL